MSKLESIFFCLSETIMICYNHKSSLVDLVIVYRSKSSFAKRTKCTRQSRKVIWVSDRSDEGLTLETSAFFPLRWPIYVLNSVVNTKLPPILSHRRSTTVSLETYPLYSEVNLNRLI